MVGIRPLSLAFLMVALLAPASARADQPAARIIVQREPGLTHDEQQDIRSNVHGTLVDTLAVPRTEVIEVARRKLSSALRDLRRDPGVAVAEADQVVHASSTDADFTKLWGLESTGQTIRGLNPNPYPAFNDVDMDIPEAWDMSLGTGRTVAVVDSGVLATHPDLAGRIGAGYDWVDEDADPNDLAGHGTHITGTIAASMNNIGVVGVAPEARILPLRVLDANGNGFVSDIIDAFHFAGEQGVRVINASLGSSTYVQLEKDEIEDQGDTLFVVAAGNEGKDVDGAGPQYPCKFDSANVICVGAHHAQDKRPGFSNFGATSVDVFAPGYDIYSTSRTGGYEYMSGTSMAAPHVAGLAALLLARNPSLTVDELKDAILDTAKQSTNPPASYISVTGGRVNAEAALASVTADRDGDLRPDGADNCPDVPNNGQADADGDGVGDACDQGSEPNSDSDDVPDDADACPLEDGEVSAQGCPGVATDSNGDGLPDMFDADGDGVSNANDNCPGTRTSDTTDSDGDGLGNACDPTPRGPDADGDGKPLLDDTCPTQYGTLPNGCPVTVAAPPDRDGDGFVDASDACPSEYAKTLNGCQVPALTALAAKARKRAVTVTVRTSRAATVRITIQRKRGHRWVRVTRKTLATSGNRVSLKVKRLRKGRYRAVVVLSSSAGRTGAITKAFRVR
jgi:thermitase